MKKLGLIILMSLSAFVFGQKASMTIDQTEMRIGEQTVVHLYFEYQNPTGKALITWPSIESELTKDIEVIDKSIDIESLVDSATSTYQREQKIIVTGFEKGKFTLPAQAVLLDDSTFYTNTLNLSISTVQIDTSKSIVDIKPIYTVDYPISEQISDWMHDYRYGIYASIGVLAAFLLFRFIQRRRANKVIVEVEEKEIIPAHIIAMEKLEKLLAQEEWKSTKKKLYYSELTDTVRAYLENRFSIHAMEQTTREIINDLKYASISEEDKAYLRKILREADMVKFAKRTPGDEEAFAYLNKSIDFVQRTKKEIIATTDD